MAYPTAFLMAALLCAAVPALATPVLAEHRVTVKNQAAYIIRYRFKTSQMTGWSPESSNILAGQSRQFTVPSDAQWVVVDIDNRMLGLGSDVCEQTVAPARTVTIAAKGTLYNPWCRID